MTTVNLSIPTGWNQLNRKQLLRICRLFLLNLDYETFRLRSFLFLARLKAYPGFFKFRKQKFSLTDQELAYFLHSVEYLTAEPALTRNNLPLLRIFGRRYYGPSDKGYNLSYIEFIHAEKSLYAFMKTNDAKYLNELCAILYRPGKSDFNLNDPACDGDRRQPFNEHNYAHRSRRFRFVSMRKRYAIYLFYAGCRNAMFSANKSLFSGTSVTSEETNPVESLRKVINDLNMGDITRNEKIYRTPVWEAFEHLNQLIENMPKSKKNGKV